MLEGFSLEVQPTCKHNGSHGCEARSTLVCILLWTQPTHSMWGWHEIKAWTALVGLSFGDAVTHKNAGDSAAMRCVWSMLVCFSLEMQSTISIQGLA